MCTQSQPLFISFLLIYMCSRNEPTFDVSYKLFFERIIRQRLLVNQEVQRMGQLRKAFIELVKANESFKLQVTAMHFSLKSYYLSCASPALHNMCVTGLRKCFLVLLFAQTVCSYREQH